MPWKDREIGKQKKREYYQKTKIRDKGKRQEWYRKNREYILSRKKTEYHSDPLIKRRRNVRRYGISLDFYNYLLEQQHGVCAICGNPPTRNVLCVDHSHQFGKVRSLLCYDCNFMLGHAHDRPEILRKAAEYLERHYG